MSAECPATVADCDTLNVKGGKDQKPGVDPVEPTTANSPCFVSLTFTCETSSLISRGPSQHWPHSQLNRVIVLTFPVRVAHDIVLAWTADAKVLEALLAEFGLVA